MWKLTPWTFFKACFWTLTACEVALIWSIDHLRSPVAHRILIFLVHPFANFPPDLRISRQFAIGWSISLISLTVYLVFNSYYRRVRQSSASLDPLHHVSKRRAQTARRVVHGSNTIMAIGSTVCYIGPGSFAKECWAWRIRFGGTLLCLMGVSYVLFWMVVIWRYVGSLRDGRVVSELEEEAGSSDTSPEGSMELLVIDRAD